MNSEGQKKCGDRVQYDSLKFRIGQKKFILGMELDLVQNSGGIWVGILFFDAIPFYKVVKI